MYIYHMRLKKIEHKLNPKVMEYQLIGWAEIIDDSIDKDFEVKNIRKAVWNKIFATPSDYIKEERCIVELNMKTSGMGSKRTYVNCSIMLYRNAEQWDEDYNDDIVDKIQKNIFDSNTSFRFYDTKN